VGVSPLVLDNKTARQLARLVPVAMRRTPPDHAEKASAVPPSSSSEACVVAAPPGELAASSWESTLISEMLSCYRSDSVTRSCFAQSVWLGYGSNPPFPLTPVCGAASGIG